MSVTVRAATPDDVALVHALVRELAEYEKLLPEMTATPEMLAGVLFAPQPKVFADIAEWNGQGQGMALWFLNFSSFRGRHGVFLEDIYVRPAYRGKGLGKALMMRLAQRCVENGWARFEWTVLDWNTPSIDFYTSIGAKVMTEWKMCRMSGDALHRFAGGSGRP